MWQPSEEDQRSYAQAEKILVQHGIRPGYRYKDEREGPSVYSRLGATGKMVCHPEGEPDMQSSWLMKPEDFIERYLD